MPRIATGYWNARNSPSRARSSGFNATRSLPRYCADPVVMVYAGFPARTWASVLFPDPFGPMMACTSPARTVRSTPRRISLPSIPACRFLISSNTVPVIRRCLEADAEQPLRLDGELHRQFLEDFL